jgi:hypothetical protein
MKVALAVLADFASVTQDGKLNILGIFHEVKPPFLPFPFPQMFLVASFEAEPADYGKHHSIRVILRRKNDDGTEILSLDGEMQTPNPTRPGATGYVNQVVGLSGVTFERAGDYLFSILVNGEGKATVPLHVYEAERDPIGGSDV